MTVTIDIETRELPAGKHAVIYQGREILRSRAPSHDAACYLLACGAPADGLLRLLGTEGAPVRMTGEIGATARRTVSDPDRGSPRFTNWRPFDVSERLRAKRTDVANK